MITLGIPHGANDHLAYFNQKKIPFARKSFSSFLTYYLGILLLYALFWILFPQASVIFFFFISAYHFGQSQLYYINLAETQLSKKISYLSWGLGIIGTMLLWHESESREILAFILPLEAATLSIIQGISYASLGITVIFFLVFKLEGRMSLLQLISELGMLFLLLTLFYLTPLLISFAVYFALWHSLKALELEQKSIFGTKGIQGIIRFYLHALPFSLISYIGIALLILSAIFLEHLISPYMLFFIAISVLTLPHMFVMQLLYQNNSKH